MSAVRHIEPKMVDFYRARLRDNGLAQEAIRTRNPRQLFIEANKVCVGIREATGNNDGPMVELIQRTIGKAEREAWCMGLQQTGLAYVEEELGIQSPIFPSEHCLTVWSQTSREQRVLYFPLPGAIIIWQHGSGDSGHTGCLLGTDGRVIHAVEGNTTYGEDPSGRIIREGGGVYFTERDFRRNGDMHVVGFLKPF